MIVLAFRVFDDLRYRSYRMERGALLPYERGGERSGGENLVFRPD